MNQTKKWVQRIFRILFTLLGAGLGLLLAMAIKEVSLFTKIDFPHVSEFVSGGLTLLFAFIFYFLFPKALWLLEQLMAFIEKQSADIPIGDLIVRLTGIILGLILAFLVTRPIDKIPYVGGILSIFIYVIFAYAGYKLLSHRKEELNSRFAEFNLPKMEGLKNKKDKGPVAKILDTSVLIDGRILDVAKTKFVEGPFVVPLFVIEELQHIADSQDASKRTRGRRGLDILNQMQDLDNIEIILSEKDYKDIDEVDSKLVKLTRDLKGKIMTNDFNLNKVASVQGMDVLNMNDLASALRPVVLSGEEISVTIIKGGTEADQGVAYLDDGTMIVVENGRDYIGQSLDVVVTSILQTSAGKMVFARPK